MRYTIGRTLRRIAESIVTDDTPTDEEIREQRLTGKAIETEEEGSEGTKKKLQTKSRKRVRTKPKEQAIKPTKRPRIKPPRRKPQTSKKWNDDTKTEQMRDYMKEYRQTGRVRETNSPKNVYVKKPK